MSFSSQMRLALRVTGSAAASVLPSGYGVRAERYLRGWEEHRRLRDCDLVVVSFGKSGRTWLRVLLSRFYQLRYGLPASKLLHDDNLHRLNSKVPRVLFTHDNYLADFTGTSNSKSDYAGKRIVLLVRNPADTAVSQFFQWKHRMKRRKKVINAYPASDANVELPEFVLGEAAGIPKVIRFMNEWAAERNSHMDLLIVRYESLHAATSSTLSKILRFIGEEPTTGELAECVEFASTENMRSLEKAGFFKGMGDRLRPRNAANIESYKVRRAKVEGYRDYFSKEEAERIKTLIEATLSPIYGYCGTPACEHVI
jgi:Sulfotransferase domain